MYKIFAGFKVKGKKKTAFGLNRLSWFLLRHNFLFEKDSYLYASLKIKVMFSSVILALFFSTLLSLFVMHVGESIITRSFHDQIKTSTQNIAFSFHPKDAYLEKGDRWGWVCNWSDEIQSKVLNHLMREIESFIGPFRAMSDEI